MAVQYCILLIKPQDFRQLSDLIISLQNIYKRLYNYVGLMFILNFWTLSPTILAQILLVKSFANIPP